MLIYLKNKDMLIVDDFKFKCCIGKNNITKNKIEGDKCTPKGIYKLGTLYFRPDRCSIPNTKIKIKAIKRNMGWCDDPGSKNYNKQIIIDKNVKHEKLFRKDHKYDYFIVIEYNTGKIIRNKGSAIFIHLTSNYRPTAGCIALKEKDFLILIKIIEKKNRININ
mgnify:CR=1 FL=1|tara:strand:+ start:102 stop:593 length:492 start_codon:yes stop_codon:yes gene_type:complete